RGVIGLKRLLLSGHGFHASFRGWVAGYGASAPILCSAWIDPLSTDRRCRRCSTRGYACASSNPLSTVRRATGPPRWAQVYPSFVINCWILSFSSLLGLYLSASLSCSIALVLSPFCE